MVAKLGDSASENGQKNVAFLSYFVLGKLEDCLETLISTNRLVEMKIIGMSETTGSGRLGNCKRIEDELIDLWGWQ